MEPENVSPSISAKLTGVVLLLLVALLGAGAYSLHQHSVVQRLSAQNDQVTAALQDTRAQIDGLKTQIATMTAPPAPAETAKPSPVRARVATHRTVARRPGEDPRWKKVQSQLDEQGRQIESTRQDLASARTELQGSIATTHDELVALERKGERNYYEFDLDKAKQFRRQGPVGIRLRKASTKHQFADLELMVDDVSLSKKHVNLLEPVVFYAAEGGRPVELVINSISKNHIHGYVSEPKYKAAELNAINAAPAGQARPRLDVPK